MRVVARVNTAAIERNVAALKGGVAAGTAVCAVVKADGYGHGAPQVARAALAGGATWLATATAGEATALRLAGIRDRLIVLGPVLDDDLGEALDAGAHVVATDRESVRRFARTGRPADVHIKLDSGMGRFGIRNPREAFDLCDEVARHPRLRLAGIMTHFATADVGGAAYAQQLRKFTTWVADVKQRFPSVTAHAANSASMLREPGSTFDMVRPGIAIYGIDPLDRRASDTGLDPALALESRLVSVKHLLPGECVGYGQTFRASTHTVIGVVSAGYADGVSRALSRTGPVLIQGRRCPIAGTVSMDSVAIDLGPDATDRIGDLVTFIGAQGGVRLSAEEVAGAASAIPYEIVCGVGPRVPRLYHRDGEQGVD